MGGNPRRQFKAVTKAASVTPALYRRLHAGIRFLGPDGTALTSADSNVSLTVNYLPHKFSNPLISSAGYRRRKP